MSGLFKKVFGHARVMSDLAGRGGGSQGLTGIRPGDQGSNLPVANRRPGRRGADTPLGPRGAQPL